ncbi:MAG: NADP-dependent oxidoreductase [Anaerolineae bacterium]
MKAVCYHRYGGPEVLVYENAPMPEPSADELLVRVHAAGVNPADRQIRAGLRSRLAEPFTLAPGFEVSGVVERLGSAAEGFQPGDAVFAMLPVMGGYAEWAVAPAACWAHKPATLDHVQAAALPVASLTAWQALFQVGKLAAGESVLIHAAAGGVGHIAVQLAHWRGARVIGTASAAREAFLRDLGVDVFVDYRATHFEDAAAGVDLVLDLVPREVSEANDAQAQEILGRSWRILRDGGRLVSICTHPEPDEAAAARGVTGAYAGAQPRGDLLARIARLVDAGAVRPALSAVFTLEDARAAHELLQQGHTQGKIVLQVVAG